MKFIAKENEIV